MDTALNTLLLAAMSGLDALPAAVAASPTLSRLVWGQSDPPDGVAQASESAAATVVAQDLAAHFLLRLCSTL